MKLRMTEWRDHVITEIFILKRRLTAKACFRDFLIAFKTLYSGGGGG